MKFKVDFYSPIYTETIHNTEGIMWNPVVATDYPVKKSLGLPSVKG